MHDAPGTPRPTSAPRRCTRRRRRVRSPSTATQVDVPAGTSVLRAAAEAGVAIPKLCATDSLKAFGSCRMCLVEVDGAKGVPASCTTPCADGMVVRTADRAGARRCAAT